MANRPDTSAIQEGAIVERFVRKGRSMMRRNRSTVPFTHVAKANELLTKIEKYPHLFVFGCIADKQMSAEKAWLVPYHLSQRLAGPEYEVFASVSLRKLEGAFKTPTSIHRFPSETARSIHQAIGVISDKYACDASGIWRNEPSSAEVVLRMLEFRGIGPKIASMAANLLVRYYRVKFSDYYSVDISVDRHVRRVFDRLDLMDKTSTVERIIFKARSMHPSFPGLVDLPAFEIGRKWCRPKSPLCQECYMVDLCPTGQSRV